MNRAEAYELLKPHIETTPEGYSVVSPAAARELLGHDLDRMLADPIRRLRIGEYVYPWNVLDYMTTLATKPTEFVDAAAGI
jgi:hypothetical protein